MEDLFYLAGILRKFHPSDDGEYREIAGIRDRSLEGNDSLLKMNLKFRLSNLLMRRYLSRKASTYWDEFEAHIGDIPEFFSMVGLSNSLGKEKPLKELEKEVYESLKPCGH